MRAFTVALAALLVTSPLVAAVTAGAASAQPSAGTASSSSTPQLSVVTPSATDAVGGAGARSASDPGDLHQRVRFELTPSEPGSVRVTVSYETSSDVERFLIYVPEAESIVSIRGFEPYADGDERRYEWDGATAAPSVTYTLSNVTDTGFGLLEVDAGDWALVDGKRTLPEPTYYSRAERAWLYSESDRITREFSASVEYYFAGPYLFLGEHEVRRVSAGGTVVEAVVPEASEFRESPSALLGRIARTTSLGIGGRDDRVSVVLAPRPLDGGLSNGDAAFWTSATSPSVAIHEYIHTRQDYYPEPSMNWFDEASAEYYQHRQSLYQGHESFD